jgi:hypothetical protein
MTCTLYNVHVETIKHKTHINTNYDLIFNQIIVTIHVMSSITQHVIIFFYQTK